MKITIVSAEKKIYVDNESFVIENWAEACIPSGISSVQFDTDTNKGHIEWTDGPPVMPMFITKDQFMPVFGHCVSVWENTKRNALSKQADLQREENEKNAILVTNALKEKNDQAREMVELKTRVSILESKNV